jgi:DnaJ-class molecular chaperone
MKHPCSTCKGKGRLVETIKGKEGESMTCPSCNGTGKKPQDKKG